LHESLTEEPPESMVIRVTTVYIFKFIFYSLGNSYRGSKIVIKYADLPASFVFQPVALKTLVATNTSAAQFIEDLGRGISAISNETPVRLLLYHGHIQTHRGKSLQVAFP